MALGALRAAEAAMGTTPLHPSAYSSIEDAARQVQAAAAIALETTATTSLSAAAAVARDEAEAIAASAAAAAAARGLTSRLPSVPARASFVLEGAQVQCGHGENASSPKDIFLTRGTDGEVNGTVDIAREARVLVWRLQREVQYAPVLSALPTGVPGASSMSPGRRRRLLSQHAEKKALAAQLALGYEEPRVQLIHRMCADCHSFFKAASKASGKRIVAIDSKLTHIFEDGKCSCRDATYGASDEGLSD